MKVSMAAVWGTVAFWHTHGGAGLKLLMRVCVSNLCKSPGGLEIGGAGVCGLPLCAEQSDPMMLAGFRCGELESAIAPGA